FLSIFENTFLVRHPAKMLPSLYDKWPDFTLEETAYAELYKLLEIANEFSVKIPVVIDSDDLVQKPEATVKAYCDAVSIPFIRESLEWEPKFRPELNNFLEDVTWLTNAMSSSGFKEQKTNNYVAVEDNEHLQRAYEFSLPYYEKLCEHKLLIAES
ncbi:MAG: sulfotransferase, partial [Okeania sp. SIO2F4]|nr:sulfotransferase [Okeania sp. SIO2F4]